MNKLKFATVGILFFIGVLCVKAQEDELDLSPVLDYIGGSVDVRSMHLWRGLEVSDAAYIATDVHFKTKNDAFKFGLWGGAGFNGNFREFDYYTSYTIKGLTFAFWDVYNFSPDATYNNKEAFNYKARETGHYFDLSVAYQFQKKFPLKIFWSTLIFGRDRGPLNEKNRYSTFVQLDYPVIKAKGLTLDASIAGAFALDQGKDAEGKTSRATFYGKTAGIVDIHLRLQKDFHIAGYKLPIYIMPMWNPQGNNMNMQVGATLFSL